jgi:hypothetical protein
VTVVLWLAGAIAAYGQQAVPVTVEVKDPSGAVVPKAEIKLAPQPNGLTGPVETDSQGKATIAIDPGTYDMRVIARGFPVTTEHLSVTGAMKVPVVLRFPLVSGPVDVQPIPNPLAPDYSERQAMIQSPRETPANSHVLVIEAGTGERGVFTAASLAEYPQTKVTVFDHHTNRNETYSGVPLMELLAHLGVPHGKELKGKVLSEYVVATGSDGYQSVVALGEVDPEFHPGVVLVADQLDGKRLDAKTGPFRLVVGEDKRPARSVRNLVKIEVKTAD